MGDLTDHSTAEYNADGQRRQHVPARQRPGGSQRLSPQLVGAGILKSNTQLSRPAEGAADLIDNGAYRRSSTKYGLLPVTSAQIDRVPRRSAQAPARRDVGRRYLR